MPQWPDLQSLGVRVLALPPRRHARFPAGGIVLSGVTTPPEGFRRLSADAVIRPGLRFTLGELRQWLRLAPETAVALLPFDRLAHTWQPPARRLRRRIVDVGDAVVAIAAQARNAGKPVVMEALDFQKKKAELEAVEPRQARMLSSFACRQITSHLKAACFRAGVEVIEVNPAYTSVIGSVNHAQRHGISVHQGAALAVARRGLGFSERPPQRPAIVPVRNGGHVTFTLPARNRAKHVWSYWADIQKKLKAAHVAHFRSGEASASPAPLFSATRTVCSHRNFVAKSHDANRSQHCSESVMDDVPW